MARLPQPGSDEGAWGTILNDFLSVSHAPDGTLLAGAIPDGSVTLTKLSQAYLPVAQKSVPSGVAALDASGKLMSSQLPDGILAVDASTTTKGIVRLAGDLSGTADLPIVAGLSSKIDNSQRAQPGGVATLDSGGHIPTVQIPTLPQYASDTAVVHLAGAETVAGLKTFTLPPQVPAPSQPGEATNKQYVDAAIVSAVPIPVQTQVFSSAGVVAIDVGTQRLYNDSGSNWTLNNVRASVGIAPAGASIIIDVKVNDATIFALPADQPTIPSGSLTSGQMAVTGTTAVATGQYITVDVTQVGSTTAGSNLTVQLTVR